MIRLLPAGTAPFAPADADEGGNNLLLVVVLIVVALAVVVVVAVLVRRERAKAVRRATSVTPTTSID